MAAPIRVLQIVTQMNRAGMENRLMDIYRHIDKNKVQFDFYTCRTTPGFFDDEIKNLGGKIYYESSLSMKHLCGIPEKFSSFFRQHQEYLIVHCHLNHWCGLVLQGAKHAGIPVRIAHSRTSLEKNSLKNVIKNILKRKVSKTATHKFAVSQKAGKWLFGTKALANGEIIIWPNAIDCEKFRFDENNRKTTRKKLGLTNELVLIHVGNIRPEKNHMFLLKVFAEIKKKSKDAKMLIVGADYMNNVVQDEAVRMNMADDIMFLGARSDIPDLLLAGDVFVFPSIYEGFPGAVLEAQAAALPCVISDIITEEVCITEHITRVPLSKGPVEWAKKVLEAASKPRVDDIKTIMERGYDVHGLSRSLEEFYIRIYQKLRAE